MIALLHVKEFAESDDVSFIPSIPGYGPPPPPRPSTPPRTVLQFLIPPILKTGNQNYTGVAVKE